MPESSLDSARQQSLQTTVISNTVTTSSGFSTLTSGSINKAHPDEILTSTPHFVVADTDSTPYLIDTGANLVIVNDPKLLKDFRSVRGGVKGVGVTSVCV